MGKEDQPQPQNQPKLFFEPLHFGGTKLTELNERQLEVLKKRIVLGIESNYKEVIEYYRDGDIDYSDMNQEELFPHYLQAEFFKDSENIRFVAYYFSKYGRGPAYDYEEELLSEFNLSAIDVYKDLTSTDE